MLIGFRSEIGGVVPAGVQRINEWNFEEYFNLEKMDFTYWLYGLNLLMVIKVSLGLDKEMSCAVCRALVDEVNYSISKIDPKKKIQVGSFRVDSKGNQATYEKSYARSEVHLLEIFENICDKFRDYAETSNDAGQRSVGRTKARDGKGLALKGIKISADIQKMLKFNCETLLEEYEDEMIEVFRNEHEQNEEELICRDLASKCTDSDLKIPMPQTEISDVEDVMKGPEDNEEDEKTDDTDSESKQGDDDLLNEYIQDNTGSIPADTVVDIDAAEESDIQKGKEEL